MPKKSAHSLPPLSSGFIRLYRVDGRTGLFLSSLSPDIQARMSKVCGRWFSDDLVYIQNSYVTADTIWAYVDVPLEVAEASRYERVVVEMPHLFGIEGKDFFLSQEWADRRLPMEPPTISGIQFPHTITEVTSNVAKVGKVLDYDCRSGWVTVITAITTSGATILTKNRAAPDMAKMRTVPIREVKPLWQST